MEDSRQRSNGGFLVALAVCTLVWAIWNESYTPRTLLQGALFSWIALFVTNRYLLRAQYQRLFGTSPLRAVRYILVLLQEIYRSGVHAMHLTISGKIDVGVVDLPTAIENPFHAVLVANAITLTPGTVTIDYRPGSFKVIWIECATTDPDQAAEMIKGRFERVIMPRDNRRHEKRVFA